MQGRDRFLLARRCQGALPPTGAAGNIRVQRTLHIPSAAPGMGGEHWGVGKSKRQLAGFPTRRLSDYSRSWSAIQVRASICTWLKASKSRPLNECDCFHLPSTLYNRLKVTA